MADANTYLFVADMIACSSEEGATAWDMKGENMAEKAYYLTQQYFGMKSKEDMTEKQDTEVVHLRREANTKVEKAEENANAQVKNLQTKLDEMTKRALKAEDALKDKTISDIPTRFATQDPASFLPGATLDGVRDHVKESGKLMVKRRLEDQIVMKAECIFCADAGREDHGDRSRGPTTSTAEWCYPWRPENLQWHHANSHPAAYAKLKELHGVAEAAKGTAATKKAKQKIDAFLEQPRNWLQHDYDLNKQIAALSDKHQAIKEREKRLDVRTEAAKTMKLHNLMETNRLRDQLQRLCARELDLNKREDAIARGCNAPTYVLQSKVVSLEAQVVQLFRENEELGDELALKNREFEQLRGSTTLHDFVSDSQQQGNIESQEVLGESQLGGFQEQCILARRFLPFPSSTSPARQTEIMRGSAE
ncbi:hypothetical protein PHYSODRAFT_321233 [Phytophthora sojae]|uniref:Uncharacterized protein n=1 Tax=Phytophthora sojae (strain P6497) TaxID=1094619 RepID=G4YGU0_PHYSP|nr:hypothetical protein PHYSODRAFT_321233 [Phytophthora sojae]EGZ27421.1 hypothetical protein PHYSODRAFT_321233 [Phytophthora sojae]|eukprot:XP_009514696.1 hypothetical protein PHYSODRAFT_321233 [Phytophthora sojae]